MKNLEIGVNVIDFCDLMARFNTSIISSVAFGLDNDCINEPNHIFRQMGAKFFAPSLKNGLKDLVTLAVPKLFYKLGFKSVDQDIEDFVFSVVKQTIEYREKKNFSRNDFMQLMIQLKNQGYMSVDKDERDDDESKNEPENVAKLSFNMLAAQIFVFFLGGKQ